MSDYINREMVASSIVLECDGVTLEQARQAIKDVPSADVVEVRHGTWKHDGSKWKYRFLCSECGYKLINVPTNYCPNCGAKMDEKEQENG